MVVTVVAMPGTGAIAADINRSGFGQRLLTIGSSRHYLENATQAGLHAAVLDNFR